MRLKLQKNGVALMLLASFFFSLMSVCVKLLSPDFGPMQLLFFRGCMSLILILPWVRFAEIPRQWHTIRLVIIRTTAGVVAMICFVYALGYIPLSTAAVLNQTGPIFTAALAPWLLRETVSNRLRLALGLSFIGMILVLQPQLRVGIWPSLVGLASGIFVALAYIALKLLRQQMRAVTIVFAFILILLLVSTPFMLVAPVWPSQSRHFLLLALLGVFGLLGQLFMSTSYRYENASRLSAIGYVAVLFSVIWDILIWHHPMGLASLLGSALIICSGIILGLQRHEQPAIKEIHET